MVRLGFRKTSKLEVLATYTGAAESGTGWRKSASARGVSHFAQADRTSVRTILEMVADKYFISKDPADYIFAVYRAVTENEPNGNGDAFPREELISWNRFEQKPVYRTFEFKPRFVNHQADDPRMARGVCLDVHYNQVDPDDRFLEVLVCYDKSKDPILAKAVEDGLISQCSMGCDALRTVCNVCDNTAYCEKDYCVHIKKGNRLKMHPSPSGEMKLAFEWCHDVTFQELSDVDDPADKKADIQGILTVEDIPTTAKIAQESEMLSLKARIKRLESVQHTGEALQMVASLGDKMAGKKQVAEAPEHHVVANAYAKHHDLSFGDHLAALKATQEETGKSDQDIRASWDKKMAEDAPHADFAKICGSLNAQLLACGDMKKAIKRAAEDHDIDHATVEKCAEHMKHSNKMPKAATEQAPADAPIEAQAADKPAESGAPAEGKDAAGGPPAEVKEKIEESAKTAALALQAQADDGAAKKAQEDKDKADKEAAAKAAQVTEQPAAVAQAGDPAAVAQAADAPSDKSMGDMGVKTSEEKAPDAAAAKKAEEDEAAKKAQSEKDEADKKAQSEKDEKEKAAAKQAQDDKEKADKEKADKEASARTASMPFAKFYSDVSARKVASGDVHVTRAGALMFTIPATLKVTPKQALSAIAENGMIAAKKKFATQKKADLGVAEGLTTDAVGGRPAPSGSVLDGADMNTKEKPATPPDSVTAQGAQNDMAVKPDKKNIGNSDVRDGHATDLVDGLKPSQETVLGQESSDAKEKHSSKNVGSDSVLSQHQVDFVTQGLDPRAAALIRERLTKIAQEAPKDEEAEKKAQDEKEKEAARVAAEKEVEKKATALAQTKMAKFARALRLTARRFALNLEPCYLKYSLGEALSNRHEASGFEGMDSDLVQSIVMRGISLQASLDHVNHMIKRAQEMAAMPDDSLIAIEADAENLEPVHPQATAESGPDKEHEARVALRRRASRGSLPVLRASVVESTPEQPTKQNLVRQAIGGGILERKIRGR